MICEICGQLLEDCEQTDLCIESRGEENESREDHEDWLVDPEQGDKS